MSNGFQTLIYPVKEVAAAKQLYGKLLGTEPYADEPYYVGFRVGGQEIGLDPHGHRDGPVAYVHVGDVAATVRMLLDTGASNHQDVRDVGGGRLIALLKDPDGNVIGLIQDP